MIKIIANSMFKLAGKTYYPGNEVQNIEPETLEKFKKTGFVITKEDPKDATPVDDQPSEDPKDPISADDQPSENDGADSQKDAKSKGKKK